MAGIRERTRGISNGILDSEKELHARCEAIKAKTKTFSDRIEVDDECVMVIICMVGRESEIRTTEANGDRDDDGWNVLEII